MNFGEILTDSLSSALGVNGAVYALAAIGLNVHFGYTGLLNFGQVGFMLVGAYGLAVSVAMFQLPFVVGLLIAVALSVLLALLLGAPTLRLRADYLAITTIAAAEILRFVTRSRPATDLTAGVFGIPSQFTDGRGFADTFYGWSPFNPNADYGAGIFSDPFSRALSNACTSARRPSAIWMLIGTRVMRKMIIFDL